MTKLPKSGSPGRRWSAARRFQGWLAAWAQDRRRARQNFVPPPTVPGAPQSLLVTDTGSLIELNWTLGTGPITGQRIYRKVDGGAYALWQTVGAAVHQVQDTDVVTAHLYFYYVVAYNAVGDSAPSNQSGVLFGAA